MKRHAALQDLSRDHYFVLVKCQLLRRALARNAPEEELRDVTADFLGFFDSDMRGHFQEEDALVVPAAKGTGTKLLVDAAKTVESDHAWIERQFDGLRRLGEKGRHLGPSLAALEARLTAHVRFEEETLFEGVQRALTEAHLADLGRASYAFRREQRAASACRVKPPSRAR